MSLQRFNSLMTSLLITDTDAEPAPQTEGSGYHEARLAENGPADTSFITGITLENAQKLDAILASLKF